MSPTLSPVAGSGTGRRRAEKRSAEAGGGESILSSGVELRLRSAELVPADTSVGVLATGIRSRPAHPFSNCSPLGVTPAKQPPSAFGSTQVEKCRKALTARVPTRTNGQSSNDASGLRPQFENNFSLIERGCVFMALRVGSVFGAQPTSFENNFGVSSCAHGRTSQAPGLWQLRHETAGAMKANHRALAPITVRAVVNFSVFAS